MDSQDKPVRRKATAVEKEHRVGEVVKILMDLGSNGDVKTFLMDKYGVSEHTVTWYIAEAHEVIKTQFKPKIPSIINTHVHKYKQIAKRTEFEDPKTAIQSLQAIERLLRLTGPEGKTFNTQINLNLDGIETNEIVEMLNAIGKPDNNDEIIEIQDEQ